MYSGSHSLLAVVKLPRSHIWPMICEFITSNNFKLILRNYYAGEKCFIKLIKHAGRFIKN